jgi:hypothetical protein
LANRHTHTGSGNSRTVSSRCFESGRNCAHELASQRPRKQRRSRRIDGVPEKHHATPEERDERVKLPLDPKKAIEAILATGPHPEDDEEDET